MAAYLARNKEKFSREKNNPNESQIRKDLVQIMDEDLERIIEYGEWAEKEGDPSQSADVLLEMYQRDYSGDNNEYSKQIREAVSKKKKEREREKITENFDELGAGKEGMRRRR